MNKLTANNQCSLGRYLLPSLCFITFALSACNNEDTSTIRIFTGDGSDGQPTLVIGGNAATATGWEHPDADTKEVLWLSKDNSQQIRLFTKQSTGEPLRIIDETNRVRIEIVQDVVGPTPNEIYYLEFDLDTGDYINGYIMATIDGQISVARILGRSALAGQVTGQLSEITGGSGSFALLPANSSLGNGRRLLQSGWVVDSITEVPPAMLGIAEGLTELGEVQWMEPGISGNSLETSGLVPRVLKAGGLLMIGVGIATTSPVYVAAGIATGVAALLSNDIADAIAANFQTQDTFSVGQASLDLVLEVLRDPNSTGIIGSIRATEQRVNELLSGATNLPEQSVFSVEPTESEDNSDSQPTDVLSPNYQRPEEVLSTETRSNVPPDPSGIDVTGQAVFQDGVTYALNGNLNADGQLSASGNPMNDTSDTLNLTANIDAQGATTGSFDTTSGRTGTLIGQLDAIGECASSRGSGGQGTFTFAHFVGSGPGMVSFRYEAFSVPDQFTVSSGGEVLFTTGRLISGGRTVSLVIPADQSAVFVSVSAPRSGTQWNYTIGCISAP